MIGALKEILIYNKSAPTNLNNLNSTIKNKIEKIFRVNPTTGSSYQVWSPQAGVLQFAGLVCDGIYIIESNSINFNLSNDNSNDGLVGLINYDKNICSSSTITPTPTTSGGNIAPTPTPTATSATNNILDPVGKLLSWGNNSSGQLGTGNTSTKTTPYQINNSDWYTVSAGLNHTAAIKGDGTLWTWGSNSSGQLGQGISVVSLTNPTQLGNDSWLSVSSGANYTIAIRSDRTLWGWGINNYRQLGMGNNTSNQWVPIMIGGNNTWQKASAGTFHTLAIHGDGSLYSCGYNNRGQCAFDNNTSFVNTLTKVSVNNIWQDIEAGYNHSIGLDLTGRVYTWGDNFYGQLGRSAGFFAASMANINNDNWIDISAGYNHCVGIRSDNTLWSWGNNISGQLGDNTKVNKNLPIQIGLETSWLTVSANTDHNMAIKSDGSLWGWGLNNTYQLGDSTTLEKLIPIRIGTSTWKLVSAGYNFSLGIN